jgi:hypothetical protein
VIGCEMYRNIDMRGLAVDAEVNLLVCSIYAQANKVY